MIIDYSVQKTFNESLVIDDIGNFYIRCYGKSLIEGGLMDCEYYMGVATVMGKVGIFKYGPVLPDFTDLISGFNLDYKSIKFNEKKIVKEISLFINDGTKGIYNVEEIDSDAFYAQLPDISTMPIF